MMDGACRVEGYHTLPSTSPIGRRRSAATRSSPGAIPATRCTRPRTAGTSPSARSRRTSGGRSVRELGMPELVGQQFAEGAGARRDVPRLREKFREQTQAEWLAQLADLDICFGPVTTLPEAMDDPQVRPRGMVAELDDGPDVVAARLGIRSSSRTRRRRADPAAGLRPAHRRGVRGLGFSAADIAGAARSRSGRSGAWPVSSPPQATSRAIGCRAR